MSRFLACASLPFSFLAFSCGPVLGPPESDGDVTADSSADGSGPVVTTTPPPPPPPATSTTTTGVDTGTGTGTSAGSVGFIEDPTAGFCLAPEGGVLAHCTECDVNVQDCPEGDKCVPWANDGGTAWNANRCSPLAPDPGAPGDPCTMEGSPVSGIDDCDQTSMCWDVDPDTLQGTCAAFCDPVDSEPCRPENSCVVANNGVIVLCLPRCDPLVPDACPEGQICAAVNEDPVCVPGVGSPGAEGEPCEDLAVCDPGQTCIAADVLEGCESVGCCTPWCDLGAVDPDLACVAEPAHVCRALYAPGEAPAGQENLGICGLPR